MAKHRAARDARNRPMKLINYRSAGRSANAAWLLPTILGRSFVPSVRRVSESRTPSYSHEYYGAHGRGARDGRVAPEKGNVRFRDSGSHWAWLRPVSGPWATGFQADAVA